MILAATVIISEFEGFKVSSFDDVWAPRVITMAATVIIGHGDNSLGPMVAKGGGKIDFSLVFLAF